MNLIKRISSLLLCAVMVVGSCVFQASAEETQVLNVYNWGVYMDLGADDGAYYDETASMNINDEFEKWYKETYGESIEVNYTTYENNEIMYQKLVEGGVSYDVIFPSDYMVNRLIQEERLEKLDFNEIPNYQYIAEEFKGNAWQYDPTHEYTVPYTWGYVGIVYNADYVTGTVNSWDVLWDETYEGEILMFNNPRDAFMIALAKNGHSLNTTNEAHWDEAYETLLEQKSLVQMYVNDEVFDKMQSGEAYLAPCYYGDFLIMQENADEDVDLQFGRITQQASNKFVDAMCIPKGCQNKVVAQRYINFLCSYEVGVANGNYTGYSSPLTNVANNQGNLYYHYTQNPDMYGVDRYLEQCEEYLYLGDYLQVRMDNYWRNVKQVELGIIAYIIMGGVILLAIGVFVYRKIHQKRLEKLQKQARAAYDVQKKAKK